MDLELTEAQFQQRIVQYAQLRGWLVSHVESVTMSGKGGRVIRQTPAAKGYPDLTLARAGYVWFLEVKTEKGSPSADQVRWLNALHWFQASARVRACKSRTGWPWVILSRTAGVHTGPTLSVATVSAWHCAPQ